jgi:hypothetical protein
MGMPVDKNPPRLVLHSGRPNASEHEGDDIGIDALCGGTKGFRNASEDAEALMLAREEVDLIAFGRVEQIAADDGEQLGRQASDRRSHQRRGPRGHRRRAMAASSAGDVATA